MAEQASWLVAKAEGVRRSLREIAQTCVVAVFVPSRCAGEVPDRRYNCVGATEDKSIQTLFNWL